MIEIVGELQIVLNQADFDRALAEMSDEEFDETWRHLGKLVRCRAKRIGENWKHPKQ